MYDKELLESVKHIVQQAGTLLMSYFNTPLKHHQKKDGTLVTQADIASEQFLIEHLRPLIKEANFFAEESGKSSDQVGGYQWVIDPLDGTNNFFHSLPYFCISVALTYNNEPLLAVIYQPLLKELFSAYKGHGAYLNNVRMAVSTKTTVKESLFCIGLPYDRSDIHMLNVMIAIRRQGATVRHLGAAALDLAYVACGRADASLLEKLSWWDVAAGILLIQEAGGLISSFEGQKIEPTYTSLIAANKSLYQTLLTGFFSKA